MSSPVDCLCACATPVITAIPGAPGQNGADGADGADGINSFTVLTSNVIIPAIGNNVTAAVGVSSWAGVGQIVFLSDGVDMGHFRVDSIPTSQSLDLEFLGYDGDSVPTSTINTSGTVSPSGTQPAGPFAIANGGTGSTTATTARAALGVGGENLSVYAAGTAYQLTNTPALLNFGTTDPSLTITSVGTWLLLARVRVDYTGATFAAVRTGTLKLRRTNNTAADLANGSTQFLTDIITTLTYTLGIIDLAPVIYVTTNTNDIIQIFGDISVVPSAGSLDTVEASIVAIKLFDQTV